MKPSFRGFVNPRHNHLAWARKFPRGSVPPLPVSGKAPLASPREISWPWAKFFSHPRAARV